MSEVTPTSSPIPGDIVTSMDGNVALVTPTQIQTVLAFPNLNPSKKAKKGKSKSSKEAQGSQGENTGRWTAEEHRLFLQGLEEHGKGWKKIASLIKSRTVVQIRTHAQKYFQKLAKARHNGEEGDVSMEGRGGVSVSIPAAPPVLASNPTVVKRRRQVSGGKRKALSDVVQSVNNDKMNDDRLPVISPVLAPFVADDDQLDVSALEDSLYRFLTPSATNFPVTTTPEPYNSITPTPEETGVSITLPSKTVLSGETSPTGVFEIDQKPEVFHSEIPSWFAKGSDVDELLNEAEALDWLADPGDLTDPKPIEEIPETLPPVFSYSSINELPVFTEEPYPNKRLKLSSNNLFEQHNNEVEGFSVFDSAFDEQAFVSALLDSNDTTTLAGLS